jgi:hypothetical protein
MIEVRNAPAIRRPYLPGEITIPALPCASINDILEFYVALGFEITYHQARPNNYAVVKYEDINLHFFTMKGYEPKNSYSTCLVLVPDLIGLHQIFTGALRSRLGKVPGAGIPRISKLNTSNYDKQVRFNIVDPGGNWIRFIQQGDQPSLDQSPQKEGQTKLSRAVQSADWVMEAEGDFAKAAEVLDKALAHDDPAPPAHRVQALVLRAAVAISLDDPDHARRLLAEMRSIPLDDETRAALTDEMQRAEDMEKGL